MDPKNSLKVMDLFAGCGGLSLGLENAGFYPVFVNELNDDARATYIRNRIEINPDLAKPEFHSSDVRSMISNRSYLKNLERRLEEKYGIKHGELDLIVGGPPCQGFSGIGHRRSYSVDKKELPSNHLFQDMAEIIRRLEPRAFLFENVRGLLNAKWTSDGRKGEIWEAVLAEFKSLKRYDVAFRLVYAKDYGVPQNRPRILMIGIRNDVESPLKTGVVSDDALEMGFLPQPTGGAPNLSELLGDLVGAKPDENGIARYPRKAKGKTQERLRAPRSSDQALQTATLVSEMDYSKHSERVLAKFQAMHANDGRIPDAFRTKKFAQKLLRPEWGPSGPSITATSMPDDYVHFSEPRILTVREWARLQMFPDWYQFEGKKTTGGIRRAGNPREGVYDREVPKYTQIGNAVPVGLAEAVGRHLSAILGSDKKRRAKPQRTKNPPSAGENKKVPSPLAGKAPTNRKA